MDVFPQGDELFLEASNRRFESFGNLITYSPKVFIPLTMLCRDKCGYCTFAQPPARLDAPFLSPEQVIDIAHKGASVGCHEALFTLGEKPELRYPTAAYRNSPPGNPRGLLVFSGIECCAGCHSSGDLPDHGERVSRTNR